MLTSSILQSTEVSTEHMRKKEWAGKTYHHWTVIEEDANPRNVRCRCVCGTERVVQKCGLATGGSRSCGCKRKPRPSEWEGRIDKKSEDECWEFQGAKNAGGYGIAGIGLVHREVYRRHYGEIEEKLFVLHTCDNPACCNPKHLWVGTHTDNMMDMAKKGRGRSFWDTATEQQRDALRERLRALGEREKSPKTRDKMSVAATGRRVRHLPDGSWTWEYPQPDGSYGAYKDKTGS